MNVSNSSNVAPGLGVNPTLVTPPLPFSNSFDFGVPFFLAGRYTLRSRAERLEVRTGRTWHSETRVRYGDVPPSPNIGILADPLYAPRTMTDPMTTRRLYGRRQGHKLRLGQADLVERLLPEISVPETGALDAATLFGSDRPLEVEIGFGAGEHLAGQAAARRDTGFIGCEPFLNGVVGALNHVRDESLDNVRLHMGDALDVIERLPDASLSRVYLLHPDPWRKRGTQSAGWSITARST